MLGRLLLAVALCAASHAGAATLSDAEAGKLLGMEMIADVKVGAVRVLPHCVGSCPTDAITAAEYADKFVPLAKGGFLSITGGVARGEGGNIVVVPGAALREHDLTEDPSVVRLRAGRFVATEIVQNRAVTIGTNEGRLILAKVSLELTPFYAGLPLKLDDRWKRPERQKALFEYDPFKREWALKAFDAAPFDREFESNSVDAYLAKRTFFAPR